MTLVDVPTQKPALRIAGDWSILPSWLPVPGMGVLPVNAFLLKGREPMLVDTGLAALSDAFFDSLSMEVDPCDLRWIWLSHTDADHIGNLDRILAAAPRMQVVTSFLGAGKMRMMGKGSPDRLRVLGPDEVLEIGGRRLHQIQPPYYDAPETMGFIDSRDQVLFAADAFGALLPGIVGAIDEVTADALHEGLASWSSIDAPWLAHLDQGALGKMLRGLEALDPAHVLSGHLPVARGIGMLTDFIRATYGRGTSGAVTREHADHVEAALG